MSKEVNVSGYVIEKLAKENAELKVEVAKNEFACLALAEQNEALKRENEELKERKEVESTEPANRAKSVKGK